MNNTSIKIFDTADILANSFAQYFKILSESKASFNICLSGGSTPQLFLQELAKLNNQIDWDFLHFYWGDERCVPPTDSESNYLMTQKALFEYINIPKENIHRIKGENHPILESVRYSHELLTCVPLTKKTPQFDLLILGMGTDGHTASIFPYNKELIDSESLTEVSLHPDTRQKRISITGKLIKNASKIVFLVTGANKASVVKEIHTETGQFTNYPAWMVQNMRPDAEWWLDTGSASML